MTRLLMMSGLALAAMPLAGCADDYGYGYGYSRPSYNSYYYPRSYAYPGYGWYDGYYGPVHDGYWGQGGTYYYRLHGSDRWRRDDGKHFRWGDRPRGNWQRWDHDRRRGDDRGHGRGRGHDRDDD